MMVRFQYRIFWVAINSALLTSPVFAASEQDYFQEFPVVLSASRLTQPQSEAPNAMTVIDRKMIAASGFRNIVDLFRLVPGMYVGYDSGNQPFVSYHGATDAFSRRMQVLVDGRTVYLPPYGGVDWLDLPLHMDDIERIEVIRGPAAASHGANSLQGVISITTRDAASTNGIATSLTKGNGGVSDVSAHMGVHSDDLDYRITLTNRADTGYDLPALNDGSNTSQFNLRSNYRLNTQDNIDFQFGYSDGTRGAGVLLRADPFRNIRTSSNFQQLDWLHALSSGDEIKVSYYHIGRNYRDDSSIALQKDAYQVHRQELGLQHTLSVGDSNRIVWGGLVRYDTADAPLLFAGQQSQKLSQVFAHDEVRVTKSLLTNLGAMFEDDGMGNRNISPRASLNYHVTPEHTLRVGASVAYRNPVMFEQYSNTSFAAGRQYRTVGSPRPEKVESKEIGYMGEMPRHGLSLDARIYQDQVTGYIYADPLNSNLFSFNNLFSSTFEGFESTVKYHWSERSNLILNYSHQKVSCYKSGTLTLAAAEPLLQSLINQCASLVPADSGSILLTEQVTPNLQFSAGYYHQEPMKVLDALDLFPQNLMRRVDLRVAYALGQKGTPGGGEIALVVQNAFQNNYTEFIGVQQKAGFIFNRRAYLTATLAF